MKTTIYNFLAILTLAVFFVTPIFFAKNFSKVAGVKNTTKYLIVSQIDKFPSMSLQQQNNIFEVSYVKIGKSQAYLSPITLVNPTNEAQTYILKVTSGSSDVFFGEDYNVLTKSITVPPQISTPISIFANDGQINEQVVQFTINVQE